MSSFASLFRGWFRPKPPQPPTPPPPTTRAIVVIVCNEQGERVANAGVSLQTSETTWLKGVTTIEGIVEFPSVIASLTNSHLIVDAETYIESSTSIVLTANINQQVWLGGTPTQSTALLLPALQSDIPVPVRTGTLLEVKCNFASVNDPVTGAYIFQNMYPSMTAEVRQRHRELFKSMGDTHYQVGNPTTDLDYHDPSHDIDWLDTGRMDEYVGFLRELLPMFFPVVFIDSGNKPRPGYYRKFIDAIKARMTQAEINDCIWVFGHECVPQSTWTSRAYADAAIEMRSALGPEPAMAMHLGDGRLSWGANPPEGDSPLRRWNWPQRDASGNIQRGENGNVKYNTGSRIGDAAEQDKKEHPDPDGTWGDDEMASFSVIYRDVCVGALFQLFFYQSENLQPGDNLDPEKGGIAERAQECLTRVLGDHWHGAPDWFAGLGYRLVAILWEQSEEWFCNRSHGVTREWMLQVWNTWKKYGWKGAGCQGQL